MLMEKMFDRLLDFVEDHPLLWVVIVSAITTLITRAVLHWCLGW